MLSLTSATPVELRAIADFYEDPRSFEGLIKAALVPMVEAGSPDKFIGFERCDPDLTIESDGEVVGYVIKETP